MNVTSSYGANGLTEDHIEAFRRYGTKRILLAYDRDEAGDRGAARDAERLMQEGIECFRIELPKGMDVNEYALKVQPAPKSLGDRIRKALWLGKGAAPGVLNEPLDASQDQQATGQESAMARRGQANRPPARKLANKPTARRARRAGQTGDNAAREPASEPDRALLRSDKARPTEAPEPAIEPAGRPDQAEPLPAAAELVASVVNEATVGPGSDDRHNTGELLGTIEPEGTAPQEQDQDRPRPHEQHERLPAPERPEPTFSLAAGAAASEATPMPIPSTWPIQPTAPSPSVAAVAAPAAEPLAASTEPPAPPSGIALEVKGEQVEFRAGNRFWRIRGLEKNTSFEQLRVNVLCSIAGAFHVDTLDLYSARQRAAYIKQAATELGTQEEVIKRDLGRVLLGLEDLHEKQIRDAMAPKQPVVSLSDAERDAALELLRDPKLLHRILADFERCGVVGEKSNKIMGYLAGVSRKLQDPLAILIQSSSAAGKTSLMEAILAFMPEEDRVKYSAMTGQSLFYMGGRDLKHKILAIVEEEGAQKASYALKLLQSEGELTIASTGKDPATGRLITQEYRVEGPVMMILTTTAIEIDEELQNRCIVLSVDEDREQTRAIHRLQRESRTLEGLRARHEKQGVLTLHQNAQRLLRAVEVVNPYARELTFLDDRTRTRRDHLKYLTLIDAIAMLHQHQRTLRSSRLEGKDVAYVEVEPRDIEVANRLANDAFGRSLDELPPQTRRLLMLIEQMVQEECSRLQIERSEYRFRARELRQATGWCATQMKVHLARLVEMEYVMMHRAVRGQSFVYELLYEGQGKDGRPFVLKLLDPKKLGARPEPCNYNGQRPGLEEVRPGQEEARPGLEAERPGRGRGLAGPRPGGGRGAMKPDDKGVEASFWANSSKIAHLEPPTPGAASPLDKRRIEGAPPAAAQEA